MPGKHRHSQRKKLQESRKARNVPVASASTTPQGAVAQPVKPVTMQRTATPSAGVAASSLAQTLNIASELKRIGILTGVILVILVILYFVLI